MLENLLFKQKLKEAYQKEIIKERKNNQFGYIKGTIGTQKIWFNSYEITQLWIDQVKDHKKTRFKTKCRCQNKREGIYSHEPF